MKIMPLVAPTPQLKLRWTELSWSVGAECGNYHEEELQNNYWQNLCLAEFWSMYEIVYQSKNSISKKSKTNIIPLLDGKGHIRRRSQMAVLRYNLKYTNDEDLARELLTLFSPFRNEMVDIHKKDVKKLLEEHRVQVEEKRRFFEKYKVMQDLIHSIESEASNAELLINNSDEDDQDEIETTTSFELEDLKKFMKSQASRDL